MGKTGAQGNDSESAINVASPGETKLSGKGPQSIVYLGYVPSVLALSFSISITYTFMHPRHRLLFGSKNVYI